MRSCRKKIKAGRAKGVVKMAADFDLVIFFVTAQKALGIFITITIIILITIALSGVIEIVIKIMIVTKPPLFEQLHFFKKSPLDGAKLGS